MISNTKLTRNLAKLMLVAVLFSLTSCSSKTVFFWNWKDVIGLSILGLAIVVIAFLFLLQWIDDKIKLWKRKRSKKIATNVRRLNEVAFKNSQNF